MADLAGQQFGSWTVLRKAESSAGKKRHERWDCRCECGAVSAVRTDHLRSGHSRACGCHRGQKTPVTPGEKWGHWTVLEAAGSDKRGATLVRARCKCGAEEIRQQTVLRSGRLQSCGCGRVESARHRLRQLLLKHGEAGGEKTPEYCAWLGMKRRCCYSGDISYANYGGRGVRVCDRWLNSYADFLADVGRRPSPQHSLDRYPDNDGDYEPGNVRWATRSQQQRNKRSNRLVTVNGETRVLVEWAEEAGLDPRTLGERLHYGWSPEEAVFTPISQSRGADGRFRRGGGGSL